MTSAFVLVALLTAATLGGVLLQRRNGQFRTTRASAGPTVTVTLTSDDLGRRLDGRPSFVLISSASCSTCPQVRRVLAEVSAADPSVTFTEVRAEERMDLVRRLGVLRTPTVLLVDADGVLRSRTSGALRPEQARTALAEITTSPRS